MIDLSPPLRRTRRLRGFLSALIGATFVFALVSCGGEEESESHHDSSDNDGGGLFGMADAVKNRELSEEGRRALYRRYEGSFGPRAKA